MVADCPYITMTNQNGSVCAANGDIVIYQPSADFRFRCDYQLAGVDTVYRWYRDSTLMSTLTSMTGSTADIMIPAGTHTVTCTAYIDASALVPGAIDPDLCKCNETRRFTVVVVGA